MGTQSEEFLASLAQTHRVLLLGGVAVIAHGLSRTTDDADVWLDSALSLSDWCQALQQSLSEYPGHYFFDLLEKKKIQTPELPEIVNEIGVVRVGGLDRYVDIFRRPNEMEETDFESAWGASSVMIEGARLLEETFLIRSKENSERMRDRYDVSFLEGKLRSEMSPLLRICTRAEAEQIFARFLDHVTAQAALENPDPAVRALALELLRELADANNPFAAEALREFASGA